MNATLSQITLWLLTYKYWIFFPLVVIEGPIVTIIAGYLASLGVMNLWIVYPVAVVGDLVGDIIYYWLGRKGKSGFWGRIFLIPPSFIAEAEKLKDKFRDHGGKILLSGKLLHGINGAVLFASGVAEMSFSSFVIYNLIGTAIKSFILMLVGYFFGSAIAAINSALKDVAIVTFLLLLVAVGFYVFYYNKKK